MHQTIISSLNNTQNEIRKYLLILASFAPLGGRGQNKDRKRIRNYLYIIRIIKYLFEWQFLGSPNRCFRF